LRISPDGNWIAFTGQYRRRRTGFTSFRDGGVPKQLTFYPAKGPLAPRWGWDNQVNGWSKDGQADSSSALLRDSWTLPIARLYSVSVDGGPAEDAADARSRLRRLFAGWQPDGFYSPQFRDFRSEKPLRRGQANVLYIVRSENQRRNASRKDHARRAMRCGWASRSISTRIATDIFNLYSFGVSSGKTAQVTNSKQWTCAGRVL